MHWQITGPPAPRARKWRRCRGGGWKRGGLAWAVWSTAVLLAENTAATESPNFERARAHYRAACAVCHGPNGRYDPGLPGVKQLDPKPADLRDPLFNSREPASDWYLVIKHGGSALALSPAMPAFKDAFSDDEIRDLVAYLKTLPGPHRYPPGDLNYLLAFRTKKAWLEDEVVVWTRFDRHDRDGDDVLTTAVELEKRWGARWQTELKLAYAREGPRGHWDELEVGFKYALYDHLEHAFLLTGGADLAFALHGDPLMEAIPFLAVAKGLGDSFTLQTSLRSHLPPEEVSSGDVAWAATLHWVPTPWPRGVFPGVELTATVPFEPGAREAVRWTVLPQLNLGLSRRGHVRAAVGVELPLNDRTYDFRVHTYLLWDFADGMFWEGWRRPRLTQLSEYE